jgi:hypothetical protein
MPLIALVCLIALVVGTATYLLAEWLANKVTRRPQNDRLEASFDPPPDWCSHVERDFQRQGSGAAI